MKYPIYCNRTLNLKKIKWVGVDMDHTLVRYHTEKFESLVYDFSIKDLTIEKNYPELIKSCQFHFEDAIRGLVIDTQNGNILKLSSFGLIKQCRHGTYLKTYKEQTDFYGSTYIDLNDHNYMAIDTAFSIAFCVLYSQLVDLKDKHPNLFPSYQQIALDTIDAVDKVHSRGEMKAHIIAHHQEYIQICPEIVSGLLQFIDYGKRFFILTNSDYNYTKKLLSITIEPFLPPDKTINDIFPYIITLANKPRFFYDDLRFLKVHQDTENMSNVHGKLEPGIYQGGNAKQLTKELNVTGDQILYIGDHIYGDIVRLKKNCDWRTALVVEELTDEIKCQHDAMPIENKIVSFMKDKQELEMQYAWNLIQHQHLDLEKIQGSLSDIDKKLTDLLKEQDSFFNKKWGKIFRAGAEETFFAFQAERYACIYMAKLIDLLSLPPVSYFRAYRRMLSHDLG